MSGKTFRYSRISHFSLMAMVNRAAKNKVKKGKKGKKQVADFDEDPYAQDVIEEQTEPAAVGFQEPAAVEDVEDDLDWANDNKKGKKNKKGGNTESPAEPASPAPEQEEGEFRILTKKEKEKLKKEKLKEQKRLAALEKKKQQEAEDAEFNKALGLDEKKDQEAEGGDAQPQQKSKKQLLKEKKAKKLAAKEAEPEAAPAVEEPAPIAAPKGKKGKGGNVAALRVSLYCALFDNACMNINLKSLEIGGSSKSC